MKKRILYIFCLILSLSLLAFSRDFIHTGKCKAICNKQIKEVPEALNTVSADDLPELSPITHFLLYQI